MLSAPSARRAATVTLILALGCAASLPWAHRVASPTPGVAIVAVVVLGVVATLLGAVARSRPLVVAGAVVAFALLPAIFAIVTLVGGP